MLEKQKKFVFPFFINLSSAFYMRAHYTAYSFNLTQFPIRPRSKTKPYMKYCTLLFACLLWTSTIWAQPYTVQQETRIGEKSDEIFYSLTETQYDEGRLLAGLTFSKGRGGADAYLVKLDRNGSLLWERVIGEDDDDAFTLVKELTNKNLVVAGYKNAKLGGNGPKGREIALLQFNEAGNKNWDRQFRKGFDCAIIDVKELQYGDLIVAATANTKGNRSDVWLFKVSAKTGNILWEKMLDFGKFDVPLAVFENKEGGLQLFSRDSKGKDQLLYFAALSETGELQDKKAIPTENRHEVNAVIALENDRWAFIGTANPKGPDAVALWYGEIEANGSISKSLYFGDKNREELGVALLQHSKEEILLLGKRETKKQGTQAWLMSINPSGTINWEQSFGGKEDESPQALSSSMAGGILLVGGSKSQSAGKLDAWLLALSPDSATQQKRIAADTSKPSVEITYPTIGAGVELVINTPKLQIKGQVIDNSPVEKVSIGDSEAVVRAQTSQRNTFEVEIPLTQGKNAYWVQATDANGNTAKKSIWITYKPPIARKRVEQSIKRIALLIGNGDYKHASSLENPVNDVVGMEKKLENLGFQVRGYQNLDFISMKKAIDDFGEELSQYDVAMFFFAGHGLQAQNLNYLVPVDANIRSEAQVEYQCVNVGRLLANMEASGTKTNIIVLDACRNNPFEKSWTRSAGYEGLASMNAPVGSLIAYATSPGDVALDGESDNGLYTSKLLHFITQPNMKIEDVFKRVRIEVMKESSGKQVPWESSSLTGDFYFIQE